MTRKECEELEQAVNRLSDVHVQLENALRSINVIGRLVSAHIYAAHIEFAKEDQLNDINERRTIQ